MTDFVATIYEWFHYSPGLAQHLKGMDITCDSFIGTDLYLQIFITMIILNIVAFLLMYIVIDKVTSRFSSAISWWTTAIIFAGLNFIIARILPGTVPQCSMLRFTGVDLTLFALANSWWSVVCFALITSFPIPRNFSTNSRLTTFWKP